MRVPLSWLREYVDVDWTPEELASRLTALGMEVSSIDRIAGLRHGISDIRSMMVNDLRLLEQF